MNNDQHNISLECVYGEKSDLLIDEIIGLWKEVGITTGKDNPTDRAKQALFIARNEDKKIIGITTTYPSFIPQLKNHMYVFRILIHKEFTIPGLMHQLIQQSLEHLESIYTRVNPYCIGVLTVVENEKMKKIKSVHTHSGFTFFGYTPNNHPMRVYFFKKAKFQ